MMRPPNAYLANRTLRSGQQLTRLARRQSEFDRKSDCDSAQIQSAPEGLSRTASLAKIQFSSHVICQSPLTEILRL
jgi:hypothetical protein